MGINEESAARTAWGIADRRLRLSWTRARVMNLGKLAGILSDADLLDNAREIWAEYIDSRTVAELVNRDPEPVMVGEQASVLASLAGYLPEDELVDLAAKTWGSRELEVHADDLTHVSWSPWDRLLTITRTGMFDQVRLYTDAVKAR
ncbi:hypothetical protein [Microbacterium aurantiacum]|uniref:hypothetical protein n=1 Tax=Microbacterium aurantiacum TaxID=162393 RepID=UPI00343ECE0A